MLSQQNLKLLALLSTFSSVWAKTVTTTNGTVSGGTCKGYDVDYFWGIPFAQAPVGDLRFAAPLSYNKTYEGGVLNATTPAPNCVQVDTSFIELGAWSEDCLFIDVWAPTTAAKGSNLPVKVWLFGGSNTAGGISDALYDGCPTAQDSIVVSINYRLGPFGFLAYPDAGIGGNFATQDQLMALGWIQDNIASFGGDPKKVLLFGQSAGAEDAFAISSLAQAPSLFSSVALMSGGGRDAPNVNWTKPFYAKYIQSLNCSLDDGSTLDCLRKVSITDLNNTVIAADHNPFGVSASTLVANNGSGAAWIPVVDGVVIPENPADVGVRVPAIFGAARLDASFFILGDFLTAIVNLTETDYSTFLTESFGPLAGTVNQTYPWSAFAPYGKFQALYAMTTTYTDVSYKCQAYRGLKGAVAKGISAYTYLWNHTDTCPWWPTSPTNPTELSYFGPTHTGELPFLFGQTVGNPRPNGSCNFTAAEVALSEFMVSAWTSMAENGQPGNSTVWPAWTPDTSLGVTLTESAVAGYINYTECEFWDQIITGLSEAAANESASFNATGTQGSSPSSTPTSSGDRVWIAKGSLAFVFVLLTIFLN